MVSGRHPENLQDLSQATWLKRTSSRWWCEVVVGGDGERWWWKVMVVARGGDGAARRWSWQVGGRGTRSLCEVVVGGGQLFQ